MAVPLSLKSSFLSPTLIDNYIHLYYRQLSYVLVFIKAWVIFRLNTCKNT